MPRKILLATLAISAVFTATASAKPYCRMDQLCINSWVIAPHASASVQSRHTIPAQTSAGYEVFFNGRNMGARGDLGDWAHFVADENVSLLLTQNPDYRKPFRARISNYGKYPARVTVRYWLR